MDSPETKTNGFATRAEPSGVVVVRLPERIDTRTAPDLRAHLHNLVRGGSAELVIDLLGVETIDSAGLSALISGLRAARQAGGNLWIARPSRQVAAMLRLTNLHRVLAQRDSADAGLRDPT